MFDQSVDYQSIIKERSVADMCVGEQACFKNCCEECLTVLLLERGIVPGTKISMCWRMPWSDTLCIEVGHARFSLRVAEAKAMVLNE